MAIVTTDDKHYKDIANALREHIGVQEQYKPEDMAKRISIVHDEGFNSGYTGGLEDGKQAEYDRFWDAYQQNGNRKEYRYAFGGDGWTDETFKPKYDLKPTGGNNMFAGFSVLGRNTSITECLEQAGVTLDTSNCTNCQQMFYACRATEIPNINLGSATNANSLFYDSGYLKKVEITVPESSPLTVYNGWFGGCKVLEDLTVNGVLKYSLDLKSSPLLTMASVQSIIDHLKDLTGATAQTLTFHATVGAKLTDAQKATITAKNWQLVY